MSSSEESLPVIAGTEITYVSGLASGGESAAKEDPGVIYEWHGDGGNITDFRYDATKGEYSFYYTAGWAWYGCQFFYRLPYSEAGDSYTVRLQFYSDVAGEIRVNGQTVSLSHGWNVITQEITLANANDTVVSVQLGIPGDDAAGIPAGALPGSLFKFRAIEVYDAVNTYHEVAFKVGEDVVKDIKVREGKTVAAPKVEAPEGTILSGWFDGEDAHSPSAPVTAAHTYTAKFVDKSEVQTYDVTVKLGDVTYSVLTAVAGQAVDLTSISAPFGYGLDGFFLDASFQTSVPGIYAIGDVSSRVQLAHVASAQGVYCVEKLYGAEPTVDLSVVPGCVYTRPEIASVGLSEQGAKAAGIAVKTGKGLTSANARSVIAGADRGFLKLVARADTGAITWSRTVYVPDKADENGAELKFYNYDVATLAELQSLVDDQNLTLRDGAGNWYATVAAAIAAYNPANGPYVVLHDAGTPPAGWKIVEVDGVSILKRAISGVMILTF